MPCKYSALSKVQRTHLRQPLSESCQNMILHFVLKHLEGRGATDFLVNIQLTNFKSSQYLKIHLT